MPILLKDVWYSVVVDFGCISSKILLTKLMVTKNKVCVLFEPMNLLKEIEEEVILVRTCGEDGEG